MYASYAQGYSNNLKVVSTKRLIRNTVKSAYKQLIGIIKICSFESEFLINVLWTSSFVKIGELKSVLYSRDSL